MSTYTKNIAPKEAFKYLLIIVTILFSMKFYTIGIPFGAQRYVVFIGACIILFFLLLSLVYERSATLPMRFKIEALLMTIPLVFSFFAAKLFHEQSFLITMVGQNGMYFIIFYFLLHQLKPEPDRLMKIFIVLGYVFIAIYLLQFLMYPTQFLNSKVMEDRGTLRIFIPGSEYLFTAYFILLGRFFITKNPKFLLYLLPHLVVVLLMGTRQMIGSLVFASLINVLLSRTIKSKMVMYFVIAACLIPFYFIFENIFIELFQVTSDQQSEGLQENIRYKATMYYLFKFNTNPLWMFIGNGMPDILSNYGRALGKLGQYSGLYLEDIGIFGDFFRFGIIFVIAKMSMYLRLLKWPLKEKYTFIRYNIITLLLTLFTAGGMNASVLALTCMMMYIADINHRDRMLEKAPDSLAINSSVPSNQSGNETPSGSGSLV
ncbi:MAG: hypothetical protein JW801_06820 [Bacteroidales bacterium]|nr:hypothetical protein [Bacteroidales bacterium]